MNNGRIIFTFLLFLTCYEGMAQGLAVDSLRKIIQSARRDSNHVNALIELSTFYRGSSIDTSFMYARQALDLAKRIHYPKGQAYAYKAMGLVANIQGNYVDALRYWKDALSLFEVQKNKVGEANMLNNIGVTYYNKGDENRALDYYLRSLTASEEAGDKTRIATAYANLGGVYSNKPATYDKSLMYHKKALAMAFEIKDTLLIGNSQANIGEVLLNQQKLDSALYYLMLARNTKVSTFEPAFTLNAIGNVYKAKKDFTQAIQFHQQAYDSAKVHDAQLEMGQALLGIAEDYQGAMDYTSAIAVYEKAEVLFGKIGLDESYDLKKVYQGLSDCYIALKDHEKAMNYHIKLLDLKDKIYNIEVDKSINNKLFNYEMDKKQNELNLKDEVNARLKLIRNGLVGSSVILLLFAGVFFLQRNRISKEKKRSDDLLLNILPEEVAEELKAKGAADARQFDHVTVMFTDFKNFTQMSEHLNAQELVNEIHRCYSAFDRIIHKHGIEKIKTIGDSYMCACGLPVPREGHEKAMIEAAFEIRDFINQEKEERSAQGQTFFEIRIGLNSGPLVAGIVGIKKFAYDIWGDTVNIASRMESSGEPGMINVSGDTYEAIKNDYICTYRGKIQAKNKGAIDMYFVDRKPVA